MTKQEVNNTSIDQIPGLNPRTRGALKKAGAQRVGDILSSPAAHLLALEGVGAGSLAKVQEWATAMCSEKAPATSGNTATLHPVNLNRQPDLTDSYGPFSKDPMSRYLHDLALEFTNMVIEHGHKFGEGPCIEGWNMARAFMLAGQRVLGTPNPNVTPEVAPAVAPAPQAAVALSLEERKQRLAAHLGRPPFPEELPPETITPPPAGVLSDGDEEDDDDSGE